MNLFLNSKFLTDLPQRLGKIWKILGKTFLYIKLTENLRDIINNNLCKYYEQQEFVLLAMFLQQTCHHTRSASPEKINTNSERSQWCKRSEYLRAEWFLGRGVSALSPPPPPSGTRGRRPQNILPFWSLRYPRLFDFECILKTKE